MSPPGGVLAANGTTIDAFKIFGATPGALYTVSTTLGVVVSTDVDGALPGTQVLATAANFAFNVQRPANSGTADIVVVEAMGTASAATTQQYHLASPSVKRFDFYGPSNETAAGFTGVSGNEIFTTTLGHGWSAAVQEFERGAVSATPGGLYRDGAYAGNLAPRTFQVAVTAGGTFDIRGYVGDTYARNQIQLQSENGAGSVSVVAPATAANSFTTVVLTATDDGDGILNITVSNLGGDPYWVLNGLDIAPTGSLPPQPLLGGFSAANLPALNSAMVGFSALGFPALGLPDDQAAAAGSLSSVPQAVIDDAIGVWIAAGISPEQIAKLSSVDVRVADLNASGAAGLAANDVIWIDNDALSLGWHLDAASIVPPDRLDLLTAVMHEFGHILGRVDLDAGHSPDALMASVLTPGARRLPALSSEHGSLAVSQAAWGLPRLEVLDHLFSDLRNGQTREDGAARRAGDDALKSTGRRETLNLDLLGARLDRRTLDLVAMRRTEDVAEELHNEDESGLRDELFAELDGAEDWFGR